mmetsp:Transcript_46483/g.56305  ORF Transcript_46483/g.56305 Transcript_46483/m.56305 type:complete len:97 (+) Transcript_46483:325-615(+)
MDGNGKDVTTDLPSVLSAVFRRSNQKIPLRTTIMALNNPNKMLDAMFLNVPLVRTVDATLHRGVACHEYLTKLIPFVVESQVIRGCYSLTHHSLWK